ncbi:hypothetical protein GA0061100_1268 [Rhizobium hainanense]|uniref:Uncharacterized protein n=1 Tax=Rhizobium hainanense TaxID=52131 RepID=A0A1C3WL37_9HYPH|nr:hypothetical protein GA0061100_1268 [Rhizobium hainanense]
MGRILMLFARLHRNPRYYNVRAVSKWPNSIAEKVPQCHRPVDIYINLKR